MKLGRNDVCHCGSGNKYKKCCLPKDDQATSAALTAAAASAAASASASGEAAPRATPAAPPPTHMKPQIPRAPAAVRRRAV